MLSTARVVRAGTDACQPSINVLVRFQERYSASKKVKLARYKVPRKVVLGPIPTTATGKIQKYVLRERAKSL